MQYDCISECINILPFSLILSGDFCFNVGRGDVRKNEPITGIIKNNIRVTNFF